MSKEDIIENLLRIYNELGMSVTEYTAYANDKHSLNDADKITPDMAMAYRNGSVRVQLENIIAAVKNM